MHEGGESAYASHTREMHTAISLLCAGAAEVKGIYSLKARKAYETCK